MTLCLGSIAPRMEAPIPGTHRLNWAPLSPKRRGLVHSARKEDRLERVTSSSLRENRLELLGSVGPCLPSPLLPLKPPLNLLCLSLPSPYFCLSLFMSLSISLCVSVSLSLEHFSPLHHPTLLSLGEKSAGTSFSDTALHRQHWVLCTSCFNYAKPHFLPQIA